MANPPSSPKFDWKMYRYVPSLAGAVICLVVFSIMAFLHLWQFLKLKNRILIFVLIGTLCTLFRFFSSLNALANTSQVR